MSSYRFFQFFLIPTVYQTMYCQNYLKTWFVLFWSYYGPGRFDQSRTIRGHPPDAVCRLGIIAIFFKINVMKKTKIRLIKNIWTAGHCVQPKRHIHGCSGSEIVVKQIFNLDRKLYSLQKYVICKSQVEIGHTFTEISLNLAHFIDFF